MYQVTVYLVKHKSDHWTLPNLVVYIKVKAKYQVSVVGGGASFVDERCARQAESESRNHSEAERQRQINMKC